MASYYKYIPAVIFLITCSFNAYASQTFLAHEEFRGGEGRGEGMRGRGMEGHGDFNRSNFENRNFENRGGTEGRAAAYGRGAAEGAELNSGNSGGGTTNIYETPDATGVPGQNYY